MGSLLWEGEAGDAFRVRGHGVAKAAVELADYSDTAGNFMKVSGEALVDVKSAMPPVPTESSRITDAFSPGTSKKPEKPAGEPSARAGGPGVAVAREDAGGGSGGVVEWCGVAEVGGGRGWVRAAALVLAVSRR